MDFLNTLFGRVLDITWVPVARQFGYVIFYNRNIEGLAEEAKNLEATRKDVQRLVDAAGDNNEEIREVDMSMEEAGEFFDKERQANTGLVDAAGDNNEEIREVVQLWKREVDVIMEEAGEFFDKERQANTVCSPNSCPNLWLRYKLSRKAKKMALKIGELKGQVNLDKVRAGRKRLDLGGPSSVVKEEFELRVSTMNQIMKALADSSVHVIGLYGLGGVGKTTLANQVAHKAQEEKKFQKVLTVDVRQNYSIRDIQNQIAAKLEFKEFDPSESEDIRARRLRLRLKQENSLLIVLDDLWERLNLEEVGFLPPDEVNTQCKFILTSRSGDLLSRQMNCERVIKVELLSEEEAWWLFKDKAAINEHSDDPALVSTATVVFQRCARLPIAIVIVASALRDKKTPAAWNDALEELINYSSADCSMTEKVYSCIKLSYNYLKGKALKSTFLLSAMFSHDPLHEEFFMYAMGLGFLESVRNMKAAQNRVVELVSDLKGFSLLLDSYSKDRFTMHDVVRDVALSIARKEQHALVKRHENADDWLDEYKRESCSAMCFYKSDIDVLPEVLHGPKVEFFYLNSKDPKLNMPSGFFKGMQEVKVLSLSNMTCSPLPSSMNLLNKLITLSLHSCTLEDIAVVGHLKKLKILNLSNSAIKQLPREVGQLSSLEILNLSRCGQLEVIPPNILSNLTKLEELYMRGSFDKWVVEGLNEGKERASLDELKNLRKLRALEIHIPDGSVLPKELFAENSLERYKIFIGRDDRWFYFCEFSKVLTLVPNNNLNMEYGVFRLFKGVEELTLENLNGEASLYESHNTTEAFRELRAIRVRCCDQLKFLFSVSMFKILGPLERIEVSKCMSLEEIVAFEGAENVEKGPAMNVIEFHRLRTLELNDLPALATDVCFNDKLAFPKLETLSLVSVGCHNIWGVHTSIGTGTQITEIVESSQMRAVSFSNLKTLKVKKCNFLLKLIPLHIIKSLSNLEELQIEECASLEVIFDLGEFSDYKEIHQFSLKTLHLEDLPELKTLCSEGSGVIISFQSLQKLVIENCNKLEADEEVFLQVEELCLEGKLAKMIWNGEFRAYHFSNVKFLSLSGIYDKAATFPYGLFYGFPQLEQLEVSSSSFSVIFSSTERPLDNDARKVTSIKTLKLSRMDKLKHIWDGKCQLDPILQNLEALEVSLCERLINLGPSFVSLENLTELEVYGCYKMINLLTSSTAKTLVQLTSLKIRSCWNMEEIITNAEGDVVNQIDFVKLKILELLGLPNCRSFCGHNHKFNFPSLDEVSIIRCPKFSIFCPGILTTPLLKGVKAANDQIHWKSNLDETIQELFEEGSLFADVHVKIDEYPTLTDVWMGKLAPNRSCNMLRSLIMDKCDFLACHAIPSYVLTSLINLKELQVSNCDSVEVIFDLEGIDIDKEAEAWQAIPLSDLRLDHLPKLKYVWNRDPQTIICFQNLIYMCARECESLRSIFPASIAKGLIHLWSLDIESCGVEVIVAEDHTQSSTIHFEFPQLYWLRLIKLPNLKNFYPQSHVVEWPQLGAMNVRQCEKLKVYGWADPEKGEKEAENRVENQYPLILSEKLAFPELETLDLESVGCHNTWGVHTSIGTGTQITEIVESSQMRAASFSNLKTLKVKRHNFLLKLIPLHIIKSLSNLEELHIEECASLEVIFDLGEIGDYKETYLFSLETLHLKDLPELKTVCSKGSRVIISFQSLQKLVIENCDKLEADEEVFLHVEELCLDGKLAKMMWNGDFRAYHFSNVKFLSLSRIYGKAATFPYGLFYGFPKLEELEVRSSSFSVMFSCTERPLDNDARKVMSIKTLKLSEMDKLKHVWDGKCQLDPILQNIKALKVSFCLGMINLGPSFVSLENLTELDVSCCDGMINLLSSSTAKTLVQLTSLKIRRCEKMEEIITNAEGDVENQIDFVKLRILELSELPNFKSFCDHNHTFNFPSLGEVIITGCPKLRIFCPGILTTPLLKGVKVENYEIHWGSDLNKTIQELSEKES